MFQLCAMRGPAVARRRAAALLATSAMVLIAAPCLGAPPGAKTAAGRASKGAPGSSSGAVTKASVASSPAGTLLASVRSELAQAQRDRRVSDLGGMLVAGTLEGAFTTLLHSAYALTSLGQALRCGAVPGADAVVVARETGRNLAAVASTWAELGKHPAFAGQGAAALGELAKTAGRGVAAAKALQQWADQADAATRAGAFEDALGQYREAVVALASALRGPEPDRTPSGTDLQAPPAP